MKSAILLAVVLTSTAFFAGEASAANLPAQCAAKGKVICISKAERKLRFMRSGKVLLSLDARFGDARGPRYATAEGSFSVFRKEARSWSRPFKVWMPYSMYFFRGEAVHYSYAFASEGYSGASHGCVNIRDLGKLRWMFNRVPLGTPVYIY